MPTHYQGSDEEIRALNAYIAFSRAGLRIESALAQSLDGANLTVSQFGVLESLLHLGPMCQSQIAGKILRSSGNLTTVIDNLEKRGLVRRERDTVDRRQVWVRLTAEGEALINTIFPTHLRLIVELMRVLTPEQQEQLRALSKALGRQESIGENR